MPSAFQWNEAVPSHNQSHVCGHGMNLLRRCCWFRRYEKAEEYFLLALEKMNCASQQSVMTEKWEPLLNNLGHVCRKLRYTTRCLCYIYMIHVCLLCLQWFDAVGWARPKGIRPVKTEWWGTGVVICLEQGADDLHMVQLIPSSLAWTVKSRVVYLSGSSLPWLSWIKGR